MLKKPNVLVVDDRRDNIVALEVVLGSNHNVFSADSGAAAISFLEKRGDIDVILMDVQMPGMDGFEAAARIKRMKDCQDIPIIFVTAVFREDPYVKRGYEAGGIDYFSKPFDPDILKMKIAVYASFRQRADLLKERERHIREFQELLRVGRKLSSVLESLSVGVLIADVEGRICQTTEEVSRILKAVEPAQNDAYGEMLGWWDAAGQIIKDDRGPLARTVHRGETSHSEPLQIRCFDGSAKTILTSASPLRSIDGHIIGAAVLIQDVTESKKIEEDLEERVTKLIGLGIELEESATH